MIYNHVIMKIKNEDIQSLIIELENKFIDSKACDYPLASGNCGVFAYALSQILSEANIKHHFRIYNNDNKEFRDNDILFWDEACHYKAPCSHIVVVINDKIYGASLGSAFDSCDFYDVFDMNKENLLDYIHQETSHWIEANEFYDGMKQILKKKEHHLTYG